jgi:hypothetical protein
VDGAAYELNQLAPQNRVCFSAAAATGTAATTAAAATAAAAIKIARGYLPAVLRTINVASAVAIVSSGKSSTPSSPYHPFLTLPRRCVEKANGDEELDVYPH